MKVVLSIAGFDPSAGAGTAADLKTIAAFGCYGVAAITALTVQNSMGVSRVEPVDAELLTAQVEAVAGDFEIAAVKIGMLPTREILESVVALITRYSMTNVVLDPVLCSSNGFGLMTYNGISDLKLKLLPLVTLITPNLAETDALTGLLPVDVETMKEAAQILSAQGTGVSGHLAILIKGGHLEGDAADVLFSPPDFQVFTAPRVVSRHTHGTGCTLSSAIAALLALGHRVPDAVRIAKEYVSSAITNAPGLGHGAGPLNHFPGNLQPPGRPSR